MKCLHKMNREITSLISFIPIHVGPLYRMLHRTTVCSKFLEHHKMLPYLPSQCWHYAYVKFWYKNESEISGNLPIKNWCMKSRVYSLIWPWSFRSFSWNKKIKKTKKQKNKTKQKDKQTKKQAATISSLKIQ